MWSGPPPVKDRREGRSNTSLPEADRKQETFDFTPAPFSIKAAPILTETRWLLVSRSLIFFSVCQLSEWSDYSLLQQLVSQVPGLLCVEQCELGLSNKFGGVT